MGQSLEDEISEIAYDRPYCVPPVWERLTLLSSPLWRLMFTDYINNARNKFRLYLDD